MFLLVFWVLEGSYSVIIKASDVEEPRREFKDYECGEQVQAKFQKKIYPAKIVKKGDNKKDLTMAMDQIISRCNQKLLSSLEIESDQGETRPEKINCPKQPVSAKTDNRKRISEIEKEALNEKRQKILEAKEEKLLREEVLRKKKETVIASLEEKLKANNQTELPSSSWSYPSPSVSSCSPRRSPRKSVPRSLSFNAVNAPQVNWKGYPTTAGKQPRQSFTSPTTDSPLSSPDQSPVKDSQQNITTLQPVSPSLFQRRPAKGCASCELLRSENQQLKRQLDDLKKRLLQSTTTSDQYSRPKADVYDPEYAAANGMTELVQGMGVFLHMDQMQTALNKAAPCVSPRAKGSGCKEIKDGKRVGRYLLTAFFSNEELGNSSLTNSELSQYPALNKQIVDAIIAFSVTNSNTPRGEILRALRASLTSKRCKIKKGEKSLV